MSQLIPDGSKAIYQVFAPDYMKIPSDKEELQKIIDQTNSRRQFPNCYATAVGKHVGIIYLPHRDQSFTTTRAFIV